ncbi:uncharacterized protein LOC135113226 [Scylla paramamosain]|uniref:uncharacterized protein LOC135113226 n=1 Tax=Scylla paramamosain TaxID=85552 RepID=UPI003082CEB6
MVRNGGGPPDERTYTAVKVVVLWMLPPTAFAGLLYPDSDGATLYKSVGASGRTTSFHQQLEPSNALLLVLLGPQGPQPVVAPHPAAVSYLALAPKPGAAPQPLAAPHVALAS